MQPVLHARGDDADDAGVPAFAGNDGDRHVAIVRSAGEGGFGHFRFDHATIDIEAIEFLRDGGRFGGVFRGEQPHAQIGFTDAATGIDAGTERKTKIPRDGWA